MAAPFLLFAPFVVDLFAGYEVVYGVIAFMVIGKTNYLLHLHIHRPFSGKPVFNLILDLSMGAVTGMVSSNWRIQHLHGHHRGIDLPYRGGCGSLESYSSARAISFSAHALCHTFYSPIIESFRKGILNDIQTPMRYRWAFCEQLLLLLFVATLTVWQFRLVLIYLLPWYVVTHFLTRYVDYLNHYGCDESSENPYLRANNSLSRWFNLTTHNFGYHTAHHMRRARTGPSFPRFTGRSRTKFQTGTSNITAGRGCWRPTISIVRSPAACSETVTRSKLDSIGRLCRRSARLGIADHD
jgi:fatty acid desaturase